MTGFPGPGQEPYGDMVKQYIDTGDSLNTVALASKADLVSGTVPDAQIPAAITRDSELTAAINGLSATYAPGGTAGAIDKPTAQGIALVQALIFGA